MKPIILEMEEAKQELVKSVNEILNKHGLSCYLIEPIFGELYSQVKVSAQREVEQARQNAATQSEDLTD